MKFSFYGLITRNLSLICIPRIVFMKTPRVSGERGKGERGKGKERRGREGRGKKTRWVNSIYHKNRHSSQSPCTAHYPHRFENATRGGRASKKHFYFFHSFFFLFSFLFFFHATKIPYNDKSWLFDRGFPDRAVYFTYKVTRWITRTIFCLVAEVLYF